MEAAACSAAPTPSSRSSPRPLPSRLRPPRARPRRSVRPHPTTGAATSLATTHRSVCGRAARHQAGAATETGTGGRVRRTDGMRRQYGTGNGTGTGRHRRRRGRASKRRRRRTRQCNSRMCSAGSSAPCLLQTASTVRLPFTRYSCVGGADRFVDAQAPCSAPTTACKCLGTQLSLRRLVLNHVRLRPLLAPVRYLSPPYVRLGVFADV